MYILFCVQIFLYDFREAALPVVTYAQVNAVVFFNRLHSGLYIAAHGYHYRIRVRLFGAVKHLAAFSVGNICHGASVYYVYIGRLIERYDFIALFDQFLLHDIQLIGINLTAKVM
jgi:hypothetical protein